MSAMAPDGEEQAVFEEKVRFFNNFLHNDYDEWKKKITNELANNRFRIPLELRDIEKVEPGLSRKVLESPVKYLLPWEDGLLQFMRDVDEKLVRKLTQPLKINISGAFGRNHVTPRGMTSQTLHHLMCVEGVVIKAGCMIPKLLQSMHVKKHIDDGAVTSRDHRDGTAFVAETATLGAMPQQDQDGNELMIEIGLSVYKDYQKFTIQETPEQAPPGQIPRTVEVICEGDLAEKCKPGDRIQVTGVYRSFPPPATDFTTGVWPARIIATSITQIKEMIEAPFVTDDMRNMRKIAERPDVFQLLSRSFAPSICGHATPKAGLLLQMIGGTERNLPNGTHLRGDINVLLIGDPSCGKSQMLRFVMNTSHNAISTTGRGSSGVGLTAAITRDPGSRDFNIEAGAMVLADRGTICIDEFDKMGQNDRVAIHEAMEQQCVTIAKAGMHLTLNARCSVTAAANPAYGTFDPSLDLAKNINMPDSLLSRFDLVFVVRDVTTEETDRKIATQVLRQAQQRFGEGTLKGVEKVHSSILERRKDVDIQKLQEPTEVFQKTVLTNDGEEPDPIVTVDFLRKYIRFCKRLTPALSDEAQAEVSDRYVEMRMKFQTGFQDLNDPNNNNRKPRLAVTTRTLEALIRLATAHAKLKLRKDDVLKEDVIEAYKLMLAAREEEPDAQRIQQQAGDDDDGEDGPAPGGTEAEAASSQASGRRRKRTAQDAAEDEAEAGTISKGRVDVLQTLVGRVFARAGSQEMLHDELLEKVNQQLANGERHFDDAEFEQGLDELEVQRNKVLVNKEGGSVILIA